jgi:eukaryotic-like serine/threonine-protein kinase
LGVVLYEMLTGKLPYTADNPVAQAMMHVNEPPRSPKEANPTVPEALDALTLELMAKNPEDRYASAAELRDDLKQLRSGLTPAAMDTQTTTEMIAPLSVAPADRMAKAAAHAPATPTRSPDHGRRRWGRISLALVALLLGLALLGGLTWTLTQGLFGVNSVEVPSLEGLTREEAQEHLAESNLTVGDADEAPSDSVPEGTVVEQAPQAGAFVDPETSVDITLSSGPKRVSVPDLTGLSLSEAERTLSEASFNLGRQDEAPSDTVPVSAVISQDPIEGTELEKGTSVDVVISTGPQQQIPAVQAIPAPARPVYDEKAAKKAAEEQKKAAKGAEKQQKGAENKGKKKGKKKKN